MRLNELERLAGLMRRVISNAYSNTLIGSAPPKVKESYRRMTTPRPGNLVIEATTIRMMRHKPASELDGIGFLDSIAQEKVDFGPGFVWNEEEEGRPHPLETVYYIRTFDGRLFRWTNALIVAADVEPDGGQ